MRTCPWLQVKLFVCSASGCGKTTTLRTIAGLERATAGDVVIAGQRVNHLPPEKRDIAMVFQFYALYPALSVGRTLQCLFTAKQLGARKWQLASGRWLISCIFAISWTDCQDRFRRARSNAWPLPAPLLGIPNAFCSTNLSRGSMWSSVTPCAASQGRAVNLTKATVIVTHDQLEALTMADRIAIMRDGLIEQVGSPHEVFAKPANVFVASFIGTPQMNLIDAQFKSYGNGKAKVVFDEQDVDLSVHPAVANLKARKLHRGNSAASFHRCLQGHQGHDRRHGRAH